MYGYNYWEEKRREELAAKMKSILNGVGDKAYEYFFEKIEVTLTSDLRMPRVR